MTAHRPFKLIFWWYYPDQPLPPLSGGDMMIQSSIMKIKTLQKFSLRFVAGEGLNSKMVILGSGLLSQTRLRGWLGEGGSLSQVGSTGGASARLLCCSALHDAMAPPPAHLLTSKPPAHTYAHPLICPLRQVELQNSEKASLAGKLTSLLTLALATLGRLLLVALPSLARSSLPAGHRATETLAPAPACGGGMHTATLP